MAERNWFDQLYDGVADAVADIREKVVEEPYFGRVVNERGDAPEPQAQERLDWPQGRDAQEPNNPERDHDADIDR